MDEAAVQICHSDGNNLPVHLRSGDISVEIVQDTNCVGVTVVYHLENQDWGSRFPMIMSELYQGRLRRENIDIALVELCIIKKELQAFSPEDIVWDIEDLSKQPPWGNYISRDITDLSNYFVTSDGKGFLCVFSNALEKAKEVNSDIEIKNI